MDQNLLAARLIKAAATGYAHQMELHNFKDDVIAACTRYYTDGDQGTIVKRAAKNQACYDMIVQALREAYGAQ